MTHKVNPSLFRLGINKKPFNFLYIDKILNKKINQQSWLFLFDFLKKTIIYSLKYVIIYDRTLKIKGRKLKKNKKFLKKKKNTILVKYNPLQINRFDILNITFNNTTHNCLVTIDKESTSKTISIIIIALRININVFDKYITNTFLIRRKKEFNKKFKLKKDKLKILKKNIFNKKKLILNDYNKPKQKYDKNLKNKINFKLNKNNKFNTNFKPTKNIKFNTNPKFNKQPRFSNSSRFNKSSKFNKQFPFYKNQKNKIKAEKINWLATENYITNNLYYILSSQLNKISKNVLFKINCNIKFATTPNLSSTLELEKIKKELEAFKPLRIPEIFKKTLYRSKKIRSKYFKTTKSLGIKIRLTGRFNGADRSRSKIKERGRVTIKSYNSVLNYDYGFAKTKYGVIGIKVWIDQGQSILWKNNTQPLSILKKNITIKKIRKTKKRKRFKKIKFKHYLPLKYITNFYVDIYQDQNDF
uniref:Ribosomal protein S3 n=1 Tax=Prototheca zopfii TaxID=3112 RepID=A0A2P1G7P6_9CHLO|nr:ribosomal protein S3 [Prototheca ciferrii]AVM80973.1 ribosomal protein S3 [Prototheca ciferrii]